MSVVCICTNAKLDGTVQYTSTSSFQPPMKTSHHRNLSKPIDVYVLLYYVPEPTPLGRWKESVQKDADEVIQMNCFCGGAGQRWHFTVGVREMPVSRVSTPNQYQA